MGRQSAKLVELKDAKFVVNQIRVFASHVTVNTICLRQEFAPSVEITFQIVFLVVKDHLVINAMLATIMTA